MTLKLRKKLRTIKEIKKKKLKSDAFCTRNCNSINK